MENELRAKILKLERALEASTNATGRTTQNAAASQRKRKRGFAMIADTADGRATKLAKTTGKSITSRADISQPILLDYEIDLKEDKDG